MESRPQIKPLSQHEGVSERTLEIALAITLGIVVMTVSRLVTGSLIWIGLSFGYCGTTFLQGRWLSRSYVVQIPFLLVCAIKQPELGFLFLLTYAVLTVLATRVNVRRLTVLLIAELVTYSLFALVLTRLAPELWLFAGFAYVSIRTLCSSLLANKTGMPLDIGAISGTWAFVSTQAFVSTGIALFYFEKIEITQTLLFSLVAISMCWILTVFLYQRAHAEFGKGVVALSPASNYAPVCNHIQFLYQKHCDAH